MRIVANISLKVKPIVFQHILWVSKIDLTDLTTAKGQTLGLCRLPRERSDLKPSYADFTDSTDHTDYTDITDALNLLILDASLLGC